LAGLIAKASGDGRSVYVYQDGPDGDPKMSIQLSREEIADAIRAYRRDPDTFKHKGFKAKQFSLMGLNPVMLEGKEGAFEIKNKDGTRTYLPRSSDLYGDLSQAHRLSVKMDDVDEESPQTNFLSKSYNKSKYFKREGKFKNFDEVDEIAIDYVTTNQDQLRQIDELENDITLESSEVKTLNNRIAEIQKRLNAAVDVEEVAGLYDDELIQALKENLKLLRSKRDKIVAQEKESQKQIDKLDEEEEEPLVGELTDIPEQMINIDDPGLPRSRRVLRSVQEEEVRTPVSGPSQHLLNIQNSGSLFGFDANLAHQLRQSSGWSAPSGYLFQPFQGNAYVTPFQAQQHYNNLKLTGNQDPIAEFYLARTNEIIQGYYAMGIATYYYSEYLKNVKAQSTPNQSLESLGITQSDTFTLTDGANNTIPVTPDSVGMQFGFIQFLNLVVKPFSAFDMVGNITISFNGKSITAPATEITSFIDNLQANTGVFTPTPAPLTLDSLNIGTTSVLVLTDSDGNSLQVPISALLTGTSIPDLMAKQGSKFVLTSSITVDTVGGSNPVTVSSSTFTGFMTKFLQNNVAPTTPIVKGLGNLNIGTTSVIVLTDSNGNSVDVPVSQLLTGTSISDLVTQQGSKFVMTGAISVNTVGGSAVRVTSSTFTSFMNTFIQDNATVKKPAPAPAPVVKNLDLTLLNLIAGETFTITDVNGASVSIDVNSLQQDTLPDLITAKSATFDMTGELELENSSGMTAFGSLSNIEQYTSTIVFNRRPVLVPVTPPVSAPQYKTILSNYQSSISSSMIVLDAGGIPMPGQTAAYYSTYYTIIDPQPSVASYFTNLVDVMATYGVSQNNPLPASERNSVVPPMGMTGSYIYRSMVLNDSGLTEAEKATTGVLFGTGFTTTATNGSGQTIAVKSVKKEEQPNPDGTVGGGRVLSAEDQAELDRRNAQMLKNKPLATPSVPAPSKTPSKTTTTTSSKTSYLPDPTYNPKIAGGVSAGANKK